MTPPSILSARMSWRRITAESPTEALCSEAAIQAGTGESHNLIEYSLKLDSNPEFTSSVIVAYARAAYRMASEGQAGCKTVFDIAPAYLSAKSGEELRASML